MRTLARKLREAFRDKDYAHAYVDEFLNVYIATQLKVLREQRGLTQGQLANLVGMKQTRVSLLENSNYQSWSITTLKKFAEAFDLALSVSFEEFGKRISDIERFDRSTLERIPRDEEIRRLENIRAPELALRETLLDEYVMQGKQASSVRRATDLLSPTSTTRSTAANVLQNEPTHRPKAAREASYASTVDYAR